MLVCPKCRVSLVHYRTPLGSVYLCPSCRGRATTFAALSHGSRSDFLRRLHSKSVKPEREGKPCPSCGGHMAVADFPVTEGNVNLDACSRCQLVWMEAKEQRKLPPLVPTRPTPVTTVHPSPRATAPGATAYPPLRMPGPAATGHPPPRVVGPVPTGHPPPRVVGPVPTGHPPPRVVGPVPVRPPAAGRPPPTLQVGKPVHPAPGQAGAPSQPSHPVPPPMPHDGRPGAAPAPPAPPPQQPHPHPRPPSEELAEHPISPWQYLPAILGLPVELSSPMARGYPVFTWLVAGASTILFVALAGTGTLEQAIKDWGFLPNEWARHSGLTIFTSMFLHANLWHLIGNLYFLVIFGDNVEDRLGGARYLLLLLLSHLAGAGIHGWLEPHGELPCIGASAAISGVIAYYAVIFPHAKIGFMWRILIIFGPIIRLPAYVALLLFVAMQLVGAYFQVQGFMGVSYLAHLGGLTIGMLAAFWSRLGRASPVMA